MSEPSTPDPNRVQEFGFRASPYTPQRGHLGKGAGAVDPDTFRCEGGASGVRSAMMSSVSLENPEAETRWYFRYFLGQNHDNYMTTLTTSTSKESAVLSVMVETLGGHMGENRQIRAILWSKSGSERLILPFRGKTLDPKKIVLEFGKGVPDKKIDLITNANVQHDLVVLEEQEGAVNFKFGILLALHNQETDNEMFSNEHGTPAFNEFCNILGKTVELKGWDGFRGGLDVKNGTTGTQSVYTMESGKEIMFHVSTMLPYTRENPQQLERKRHLGNDICNIVFMESSDTETPFSPEKIKSKFNHIFAVVVFTGKEYIVKIYTRNNVPEYGPSLPSPSVFTDATELRRFLLVKLMNGEKSALSSPYASFATKKTRTLQALIEQIHQNYNAVIARRSPKTARRANEEMFRNHGQAIKVAKVASGAAPTSTLSSVEDTTGTKPWTPFSATQDFPFSIISACSWEADLVVAVSEGVLHLPLGSRKSAETSERMLVDNTFIMTQMEVDESSNIIYMLAVKPDDSSRRGMLYAVPLAELMHLEHPLNKKTLRNYQIPASKECHIFAINRVDDTICTSKFAVAIGRKIRVFQQRQEAPTGIPGQTSNIYFVMTQEVSMTDQVETLAIGYGNVPGSSGQLCVGLRTGDFYMVDLETGMPLVLYAPPSDFKSDLVVCMNVPSTNSEIDNDDSEWLLCFNQMVIFKDTAAQTARFFDVRFNARPRAVAYAYPYLLGFLSDSIEIITLINGSLVKTLPFPGLVFLCAQKDIYFGAFGRNGNGNLDIFRISRDCLAGKHNLDDDMAALSFAPAPAFV